MVTSSSPTLSFEQIQAANFIKKPIFMSQICPRIRGAVKCVCVYVSDGKRAGALSHTDPLLYEPTAFTRRRLRSQSKSSIRKRTVRYPSLMNVTFRRRINSVRFLTDVFRYFAAPRLSRYNVALGTPVIVAVPLRPRLSPPPSIMHRLHLLASHTLNHSALMRRDWAGSITRSWIYKKYNVISTVSLLMRTWGRYTRLVIC